MNILNSRDLQKRLNELQDERDTLESEIQDLENELEASEELEEKLQDKEQELEDWDQSDEAEELEELKVLADEVPEWHDGATLIDEDDFEEYCEELCKDIGDLPKNIPHYIVIDWEATANNIRADYSSIDYQGTTYLYRNC